MRSLCFVFVLIATCFHARAQHTVDFTVPATVCKNEVLPIVNNSEAGTVEWNFCASELNDIYESTARGVISTFLTSIEVVEDNGTWYGFATSRNNELLRLDFGALPFNPDYELTSLGNPGTLLNSPEGISIVKDGDAWYGLVTNLTNHEIVRLKWTSLTSTPSAVSLSLAATGKFSQPSQVEIHRDNNEFIAIVANGGTNKLTTINFHASMETVPTGSDVLESVAFPGAANMFGVSATRQCDGWEIYSIATDKIYRSTVPALFTAIGAGQIDDFTSDFAFTIGSFNKIRSFKYFDRTYFYFTSFTGGYISGASWQTGAASPQLVDLGSITPPALPFSLAVVKDNDSYGLYVGGFNNGMLNAIQARSTCNSSSKTATDFQPTDIRYTAAGTYRIGLNIAYPDGQTCSTSQTIVVTGDDAPPVDFAFDNICQNSTTTFTLTQSPSLPVTWDYGDGNSDTGGSHVYSTPGTYQAIAEVTAPNTCKNRKYEDITIYAPPVAGFNTPAGLLCSNNQLTFVNTTVDNFEGNLAYSWEVNNVEVSTSRDLIHLFPDDGDNEVRLVTSIPGCSDDVSQVINDMPVGPLAQFDVTGSCEDEDVSFTNTSSGDITGFLWSFDDGTTSNATSPGNTFEPGVYNVSLSATASNGCVGTSIVEVPVYSKPVPAFSLDLPPFSCSGTPSQFHDTTPSPTDSNIQSWAWTFDDGGSGTGKNPVHTYEDAGDYNVTLETTTDKGCSGTVTQEITITQSPSASFDLGPACVNQSTKLTDTSGGDADSWQWKIGSATYTSRNAQHTFSTPGNYSVQLTITGENNCTNTLTKQVTVHAVPAVDFEITNPCAGQPAVFTDVTASATDPVAQQAWTFNNNSNASGQQPAFSFDSEGSYPAKLQITTQSGCVYSTSKQVSIYPSPVASFTMSDQSGPPPLNVVFNSTSTGAVSYLWTFDDGTQATGISADHSFTALGDHVVNLTVTNSDECSHTQSQTVTVVDPLNELAITEVSWVQLNGPTQVYIRVKNNGNYRIDGFGVTLDIGGSTTLRETVVGSLAAGEEKFFNLGSQFTVQGDEAFLCAELDADENVADNRMCILFSGGSSKIFNASPNPANDYLTIESIAASGDLQVKIYNMSGALAFEQSFSPAGYSRLSLDIQHLSPGLYVVVVSTPGAMSSQKILIAR